VGGGSVQSFNDHRLAMALAAAALAGSGDVQITGAEAVAISYPTFWQHLHELSQ
jgi:3-phosphoshikimate 1-carboxyvinyltransferase